MARTATLSVLGLYNYNSAIFDSLKLPDAVNRETLVNGLLAQLYGLEILYPDADLMEKLLGVWSAQRLDSWRRMADVLAETYNPIHNFDRNEEWTQIGEGSGHSNTKVAGFDSESLVDSGAAESSSNSKNTHFGHLYGNIGVTKTQEMIRDEINLRRNADIYQIIIDEFKNRFCILVY